MYYEIISDNNIATIIEAHTTKNQDVLKESLQKNQEVLKELLQQCLAISVNNLNNKTIPNITKNSNLNWQIIYL